MAVAIQHADGGIGHDARAEIIKTIRKRFQGVRGMGAAFK
ncbi:hypothetical protein N007_15315 [Alicyclobacillus acidoterrestris ATCC 49025]|nr:hypothetical protein N007_15315 [Alicyclobacillus acidoterrestris ATCC 49025]